MARQHDRCARRPGPGQPGHGNHPNIARHGDLPLRPSSWRPEVPPTAPCRHRSRSRSGDPACRPPSWRPPWPPTTCSRPWPSPTPASPRRSASQKRHARLGQSARNRHPAAIEAVCQRQQLAYRAYAAPSASSGRCSTTSTAWRAANRSATAMGRLRPSNIFTPAPCSSPGSTRQVSPRLPRPGARLDRPARPIGVHRRSDRRLPRSPGAGRAVRHRPGKWRRAP